MYIQDATEDEAFTVLTLSLSRADVNLFSERLIADLKIIDGVISDEGLLMGLL